METHIPNVAVDPDSHGVCLTLEDGSNHLCVGLPTSVNPSAVADAVNRALTRAYQIGHAEVPTSVDQSMATVVAVRGANDHWMLQIDRGGNHDVDLILLDADTNEALAERNSQLVASGFAQCYLAGRDSALDERDSDLVAELTGERDLAKETVERLERQLEAQQRTIEQLRTTISQWEVSFGRVGDRLMTEAIERQWCSEYDSIVADLNSQLPIGQLPLRWQSVSGGITLDFSQLRIEGRADAASEVGNMARNIYEYCRRNWPNVFDDYNYNHECDDE